MPKESALQKKIIARLNEAGYLTCKVILCNLNGWPDIQAFRNGRVIFIEAKAPGKQATPLQQYRHRILREQGFEVHVIDSIEEFNKLRI